MVSTLCRTKDIMKYPKLYIGPMSKNIVDSVIELSAEEHISLGFCASRRQIEYNGGYVNNWTTESFSEYVSSLSSVLVCRDHGGPGQGVNEGKWRDSFECDAKFMNIIHIDPWKDFKHLKKAISKTAECIEFCNNTHNNCIFEVSTEEAIRKLTPNDLYIFLKELKLQLGAGLFGKILYVVIQSGTSLEEDKNIGNYDKERLKKMINICRNFSVLSKEHNGDYLSSEIIKEKFDLGLDAINIAPEFGVIETLCILDRVSDNHEIFNKIYQLCYDSRKWEKWVGNKIDPTSDKRQIIKICCHYIFSNEEFKKILELEIFDEINEEIKYKVKNRIRCIVGEC